MHHRHTHCLCGPDLPGHCPGRSHCPMAQGPSRDDQIADLIEEIMTKEWRVDELLDGVLDWPDDLVADLVSARGSWRNDRVLAEFGRRVILEVEHQLATPAAERELDADPYLEGAA
jgi:hypothetical protein